jgi:hypothetical protein
MVPWTALAELVWPDDDTTYGAFFGKRVSRGKNGATLSVEVYNKRTMRMTLTGLPTKFDGVAVAKH